MIKKNIKVPTLNFRREVEQEYLRVSMKYVVIKYKHR